jgi:hypothetical protein
LDSRSFDCAQDKSFGSLDSAHDRCAPHFALNDNASRGKQDKSAKCLADKFCRKALFVLNCSLYPVGTGHLYALYDLIIKANFPTGFTLLLIFIKIKFRLSVLAGIFYG